MKKILSTLLVVCLLAGALSGALCEALELMPEAEAGAEPMPEEVSGEDILPDDGDPLKDPDLLQPVSLEESSDDNATAVSNASAAAEATPLELSTPGADEGFPAVVPSDTEAARCAIESDITGEAQFAAYARRFFYGSGSGPLKTMASASAGEQLSGQDRALYEALKPQILEIAAGERSATRLQVPVSTVLGQESFSAEDALSHLVEGKIRYSWSLDLVCYALWFDCTWEMYWLDRYGGTNISSNWSPQPFYLSDDGSCYVTDGMFVTFSFPVLEQYRLQEGLYQLDTSLIQNAKLAADNASAIVSKYAACSDYVKLYGYAWEICRLVSYNEAATRSGWDDTLQDPWKLIWVFDGDDTTNVVCEGYAQAFQYLCELTDFDGKIRCILATGTAQGVAHSWNVVRMDDGKNYVVDVTWMDRPYQLADLEGTMTDWISLENGSYFLCGASKGSVEGGYTLDLRTGGATTDRSYRSDTLNAYSASALKLAKTKYVLNGFVRIGDDTYYFDDGRYVTGPWLLADTWYDFDEEGRLEGTPSGWRDIGSGQFYFESDGTLHTKHIPVTQTGVAASCTEDGLTEGITCAVCGAVLSSQTPEAAVGHRWDGVRLYWSDDMTHVTALRVCLNDSAHQQTETAEVTHAVTTEPTCIEMGVTTYTAMFENAAFGTRTRSLRNIPTAAHKPVTDKAVAATYTDTGLTRGSHCAVCGAVLVAQEVIEKRPLPEVGLLLTKNRTKTL
ncbi:MAG: hypothetical protein IJH38_03900, partial [Clostridia bacterium]|nr:hypothetical protein [Clostridia bacterium]